MVKSPGIYTKGTVEMAKHKQQQNGGTVATVEAGQMPPVPQTDADGQPIPGTADGLAPKDGEPNAGAAVVKPKESKRSRFIRLASRRVSKALKALAVIENLGNKAQYDYTEEHAQRIIDALAKSVRRVEDAFSNVKPGDAEFTL